MADLRMMWRRLMAGLGAAPPRDDCTATRGSRYGEGAGELRVCVDLTEVLPDDLVYDVVLWPAQWHRRVELVDAVVALAARRRAMRVEIVGERGDGWVERWWLARGAASPATVEGRIRLRLR